MPAVEIVDLRQELKAGNRGIFSRSLLGAMRETLAAEHQALLFLNRRGAATSVVCRDCGYVVKCPLCEIPLTFHSATTRLICHRCNRRVRTPSSCPECRSAHIRYLGVGTQRVAEEAGTVLPGARILRWDRDVTSKRGAHEAISMAFGNHEADILVGTQMIAKGLDFPLVTLVGVILADVGLNLPDFRAAERIFQLLTQVAGRAGRAELPSRVIIQTYNPEHYALKAAQAHDYWDFYRQEMTFRGGALYPPYSRMVRFIVKDRADDGARARAEKLRDDLVEALAIRKLGRTEILGPAPAFIGRLDGVYQWHLVVRGGGVHEVLDAAGDDVIVDVDPVDLL
jgi:primosomal protein N' (replication factor Y)